MTCVQAERTTICVEPRGDPGRHCASRASLSETDHFAASGDLGHTRLSPSLVFCKVPRSLGGAKRLTGAAWVIFGLPERPYPALVKAQYIAPTEASTRHSRAIPTHCFLLCA